MLETETYLRLQPEWTGGDWLAEQKRRFDAGIARRRLGRRARKMTRADELAAIAHYTAEHGVRRLEFDGRGGVRIRNVSD